MENLQKVLADTDFINLVLKMQPTDAVTAFKEHGVDCTVEDLMQVKEIISSYQSGELSEEDLEKVAGGGKVFEKLGQFGTGFLGGIAIGIIAASSVLW